MNRERRKAVAKVLRSYRALRRRTPEQVAKLLGWPLAVYKGVEAAAVSLSEGEQHDIRVMLRDARDGVS